MNNLIAFLFLLLAPISIQAKGYCDEQLVKAFDTALQLEETRQIWDQINEEGEVRIVAKQGGGNDFTAYWEGQSRVICINVSLKRTVGEQLSSILFEMQNALKDKKSVELYNQASRRKISNDTFAREMERLEYENSLNACTLVEKGVKSGIFPKECHLERYPNFEEFLVEQKKHGHYQHYLRTYQGIEGVMFS